PVTTDGREEPSYGASSQAPWTKGRRGWAALAAGGALLGAFGLALAMWGRSRTDGPTTTTAPSFRSEAPPAPPVAASIPPPFAPSEPTPAASSSTMGNLSVSSSRGHRVWVDGRLAGQAPFSLPVACGRHAVRVGSHGGIRRIDVPCGGDIDVH
ncbi:MAG: PEGA domain-containing protein, partial [Myxococcota bacterium]|nr:PEGA domain-containing protein [Myxococcota bacterium]